MAKNTDEALRLIIKAVRMHLAYWSKIDRGMDAAVCKDRVGAWLDEAEQLLKGSH